jgi:argininosuccinate lyase
MQEDKVPVFEAADTLELCLAATAGMVLDLTVDEAAMRRVADSGYSTATDLADWLVRVLGLPFREAHHVTGTLVKTAETRHCALSALALADMQAVEPRITEAVYDVLTVDKSVASRTSFGGTAPANVTHAAAVARRRFLAKGTP